jgi:hypothetical protein
MDNISLVSCLVRSDDVAMEYSKVDAILLSNTPGKSHFVLLICMLHNKNFLFPPIIQALVAIYTFRKGRTSQGWKRNWEKCIEFHPGTKEEAVRI